MKSVYERDAYTKYKKISCNGLEEFRIRKPDKVGEALLTFQKSWISEEMIAQSLPSENTENTKMLYYSVRVESRTGYRKE